MKYDPADHSAEFNQRREEEKQKRLAAMKLYQVTERLSGWRKWLYNVLRWGSVIVWWEVASWFVGFLLRHLHWQ